jgi:hypothetical protein
LRLGQLIDPGWGTASRGCPGITAYANSNNRAWLGDFFGVAAKSLFFLFGFCGAASLSGSRPGKSGIAGVDFHTRGSRPVSE